MTPKPVVPREQANRDIDAAVSHYLTDATQQVALDFIDALQAAYTHITQHPAAGSRAMPTQSTCRGCASGPSDSFDI